MFNKRKILELLEKQHEISERLGFQERLISSDLYIEEINEIAWIHVLIEYKGLSTDENRVIAARCKKLKAETLEILEKEKESYTTSQAPLSASDVHSRLVEAHPELKISIEETALYLEHLKDDIVVDINPHSKEKQYMHHRF